MEATVRHTFISQNPSLKNLSRILIISFSKKPYLVIYLLNFSIHLIFNQAMKIIIQPQHASTIKNASAFLIIILLNLTPINAQPKLQY